MYEGQRMVVVVVFVVCCVVCVCVWCVCSLYTSDAAEEEDRGDLGGRRLIKNKLELFYKQSCI